MRKVILSVTLSLAAISANAQWHHGHGGYYHHGGGGWGWVGPAFIGGVIGYEIARPPVYVQPAPPVVIQQSPQPVIVQGQNCSPWTQIQNPDGSITTTRTCQ